MPALASWARGLWMLAAAFSPAAFDPAWFDYDRRLPIDLRETSSAQRDGVLVRDVTFANAAGGRTAAYLLASAGKVKSPAVLFVHWYDPPSKDSNRTQYLDQAVILAQRGVTSLLIETMWSEPEWFPKRNPVNDFSSSVQQVKELRRALDVLIGQPNIDKRRVAYVGHDFGAMYGAVLAGIDHRVSAYAFQAGTTSFSDWFLLGRKLEGTDRQRVVDELAPLDPVRFIGRTKAPVLFQFARSDRFVPIDRGEAFFAAAREPKKILWYEAGHGLNEQAIRDRMDWLRAVLKIGAA